MRHTFNLVSPNKERSAVRLIVSHGGEKFRRSIGVTVSTKLWNRKGRSPDKMCKDARAWAIIGPIHAMLVESEIAARSRSDVISAISHALGDKTAPCAVRLWDYFKDWSERETPSRRFRRLAYERISEMMGTDEDWGDVDGDWYFRFVREANSRGYSPNYVSTLIAKLKTVMNEALARGIHSNTSFKKFRTAYKAADAIALTKAEVDALWDADLSGVQARARDCFIVGVYCAGRFQDYSKLSYDNIAGGMLRYVQRKTGEVVIIPCSSRIKDVFERNGGRVPKITEQEVGREIKKICHAIGGTFNDSVEVRKTRGGLTVVEMRKRYELVSTHTARRTGASILYKSGVPIRVCRFLTGHTTDSMFLNYVKIDKEEGAKILATSDFFR